MPPSMLCYKDGNDDVVYLINAMKYVSLHESMKRHIMKNLMKVHDQNLDLISLTQIVSQSGKVYKSAPIGGYSTSRPFNRRPGPNSYPAPKKTGFNLKFDLGVFPSDDFRLSMDTSSLPTYYRLEQNTTPVPRVLNCPGVSAPINVLIGNLAVLKQNSNAHNFVAATGIYSSQTPSQSFFTYFYGSAIDQYYQIVRNGYQ
uniref:DNA topoisomerase 2-beta n=1 Tax=Lygus hesperus TaxID=30085 RepID=A0A0A9YZM4_LYGHE